VVKSKKDLNNTILIAIIFGVIAGGITSFAISEFKAEPTEEELIKEFYDVENAVHISPHGLRKHMGEDPDVVLVDLRSQEEYEEEHITGAINIPAYKDRDHSDYGAVDRIVGEFKRINTQNTNTEFIVYCYSSPCMTGRKVGKILTENDIYVKHLGIGWNEWRYFWTLWNHPHEWEITNVEDYISVGPEPGEIKKDLTGTGCPIEGGLGC
tara:strand:+ start:1483 stop:2112 length:630 start_codon:yes stop_codon:yes gene_type:complete